MKIPIIVIGGGGHAKVLIDTLLLNHTKVIGFTDLNSTKTGKTIQGVPWLGKDEEILNYSKDSVLLANGLGSVNSTIKRRQLFDKFKKLGYSFITICHPSVIISPDVTVNEGAQIMAGAIIQPGSYIGSNTILNTKVSVDHDCFIGNHVHLAPGVTLSGNVRVNDGVHIGTGAVIIQGINIGEESIVGAGGLVLRDVPPKVTVVGVPAKEK